MIELTLALVAQDHPSDNTFRLHQNVDRRGAAVSEPILVIDTSEVREGKLDEVKSAFEELAAFVEANEAEPLAYNVYFHGETRVTVVQLHPDTASLELHMQIAGPKFARFADLLTLLRVDVYGAPSEAALERFRRKAEMLGNAPVVVNDFHAGFTRARDTSLRK